VLAEREKLKRFMNIYYPIIRIINANLQMLVDIENPSKYPTDNKLQGTERILQVCHNNQV